jgi:hypothetical protein
VTRRSCSSSGEPKFEFITFSTEKVSLAKCLSRHRRPPVFESSQVGGPAAGSSNAIGAITQRIAAWPSPTIPPLAHSP